MEADVVSSEARGPLVTAHSRSFASLGTTKVLLNAASSLPRTLLFALFAATLWSMPMPAQRSAAAVRCDRVGTTTITFGRTGGSIKPAALRVNVDGSLSQRVDGGDFTPSGRRLTRDAVAGLARLAWSGGFTTLPTAPTKPTRNPDAARDVIEIQSACGRKHVEYAAGEGAPAFRELLALLQAVTR